MPRSNDLIVADAGPLIALARVLSLEVLPKLFGQVWVTETVLSECIARPNYPEGTGIQEAVRQGWLRVRPDGVVPAGWQLDAGETSAIAAALELRAALLIDDRAGRRVAVELGLPVIGALGVLVRARQLGHIERMRPLVEHLAATGYFLSGQVIDAALRKAGE